MSTLPTPPDIIGRRGHLEPAGRIFQRLLKERIVFIGSAIDQNTANLVCAQLVLLEAEDAEKDISLYINSPGGSVTDGLAIYDTMQYVRPDVTTICVGLAASMGQFLLCSGAPGKRYALPALAHPDAPAVRVHAGPGRRHRHPGGADHLPEADDGRAHRLPHRPAPRADRGRLGPRPLVHGRRGLRVRLHRPGHRPLDGHGGGGNNRRGSGRPGPAVGRQIRETSSRGTPSAGWPTRSPMAAEAAGVSTRQAARATRSPRIVTPTISVRKRLREIWLSRELLIYLVRTEIKVKYKNSALGLVWSMISPAMTLAIYFFVFHPVGQQDAELRHLPLRRPAPVEPLLSSAS